MLYQTINGSATANSVYYKANAWGIDYYDYIDGDPRRMLFMLPVQGMRVLFMAHCLITENACYAALVSDPGVVGCYCRLLDMGERCEFISRRLKPCTVVNV